MERRIIWGLVLIASGVCTSEGIAQPGNCAVIRDGDGRNIGCRVPGAACVVGTPPVAGNCRTIAVGCQCAVTPPPNTEGCGCSSGRSGAVSSLPTLTTLHFDNCTCQVTPPTEPLFGLTFTDTVTTIPLAGSLQLSFEPGFEPTIPSMRVTAIDLVRAPFLVGGHTVEILAEDFVFQEFRFNTTAVGSNVEGPYTLRYELRLDGMGPFILYEPGRLGANFDSSTGTWSEISFGGGFQLQAPAIAELVKSFRSGLKKVGQELQRKGANR